MTEPTRYQPSEDLDIETPEDDAAEQKRAADQGDDYDEFDDQDDRDERAGRRGEIPLEVDPADAADQDRVAGVDEDDYR